MNDEKIIVLDFETTNKNKGDPTDNANHVVCCAWKSNVKGLGSLYGNEYEIASTLEDLLYSHDLIIGYNIKFELGWLKRCGLDIHKLNTYCTMIGEYTIAGNRRFQLDLDSTLARYYLGSKTKLISHLIKSGVCPSDIPKGMLLHYCEVDVIQTYELYLEQIEIIKVFGLEKALATKQSLTPALVEIEFNGMHLDPDVVDMMYQETVSEINKLSGALKEFGDINYQSNKQLTELLYDKLKFKEPLDHKGHPYRTPKGDRKADAPTIALLKPKNKLQREFLELYQSLAKLETKLGNYLSKFKDCITNSDGIIRANLNQTVTKTGRLSSTGKVYKVQYQNIDRTLKACFNSRNDDWIIIEADYVTQEFRDAVYLGRDPVGLQDILDKIDAHTRTAKIIGGLSDDAVVEKSVRQAAKAHTFKPLYAGRSGTKNEQRYYKWFMDRYQGIAQWQNRNIDSALKSGKVINETGLIFYFKPRVTPSGYIEESTKIANYPVQYFSGEKTQIVLPELQRQLILKNLKSRIVNTVHDNIVLESPRYEESIIRGLLEFLMIEYVIDYYKYHYNIDYHIPIEIEIKSGSHWG